MSNLLGVLLSRGFLGGKILENKKNSENYNFFKGRTF